jgi:hypothetical protein
VAKTNTGPLAEADEAAAELADALGDIGIVLPSLRGDWPAANGGALVQLGAAPTDTVRRLAAWIRGRPS